VPYSATAVANCLVELAESCGEHPIPMKIHKMIYFAHGWHLAITGKPLIREQIVALYCGPAVASICKQFGTYGNEPIKSKVEAEDAVSDDFTKEFLKKMWDEYGFFSAYQLANLTHQEGTPWDIAFAQPSKNGQKLIDDELLMIYFQRMAKEEDG
jgi:uncharacterized phage-associated protein